MSGFSPDCHRIRLQLLCSAQITLHPNNTCQPIEAISYFRMLATKYFSAGHPGERFNRTSAPFSCVLARVETHQQRPAMLLMRYARSFHV